MPDPNFDADDLPSDLKDVPRRNLKRLLHRCKTSDELTERDREVLARLWQNIKTETKRNEEFGGHHANDILGDCFRLARGAGGLARTLADGPEGKAALDRLEQWIADKDLSGYVGDDYHSSLRLFGGFMTDGGRMEWPDRFDELPTGMRDDVDPAPKKTNILHYEEVGEMAKQAFNDRDPATIMVQWSSGCRPMSELHTLQFKDIEDHGDHFVISIPDPSKTGKRDIKIHVGAPQLRRWIKNHPAQEKDGGPDPEDPVWAKTTANERISYTMYREIFYAAAERAGITKDHNPQHFRHSRASVLASRHGVSQVDLENRFGWKRGSDSAEHYITRFAGESERHIAAADGVDIDQEDEPDPIAPVKCLDCDKWTPRYESTCIWCESEVDPDATVTIDDFESEDESEDMLTLIMNGDVSARDLRGVKRVLPVIRSRPEILDRLDELITMLDRLDEDDEGVATATGALVMLVAGTLLFAVQMGVV